MKQAENDTLGSVQLNEGAGASAEACKCCRYFSPFELEPITVNGFGNCRRYPPVADGLTIQNAALNGYDSGHDRACDDPFWWGQPCVTEDGWCGEWRQAPKVI